MKLKMKDYRDMVRAGWLGKCLGGTMGARFENHKCWDPVPMEDLWPREIVPNDDLDIQIVWLEAMQERGLYLSSDDLAEYWQDRCWYNFCEYGHFLHNVQRGIRPPLSGTWNNRFFSESEGCPIRSEIWGFVSPGNPALAAEMARLDAQLDHGGMSVEIECFLAAAASAAFATSDLDRALRRGLSVLPPRSRVRGVLARTREICAQYPEPHDAWRVLVREFGDRDASKAVTNLAITLFALFLGRGDFSRTVQLCIWAGWDTDCTAATAGALLGVLNGSACLPAGWLAKLGPNLVCGIEVRHKNSSLEELTDATCLLGVEMAGARNSAVTLVGAPQVAVRPVPAPAPRIDVVYPGEPVLRARGETPVTIVLRNPGDSPVAAPLKLEAPASCVLSGQCPDRCEVPGGSALEVSLCIRHAGGEYVPDKNLFRVSWGEAGRPPVAAREFGLGGARQWRVYGPYWDMWDVTRNAECPYNNAARQCNPFQGGCGGDSYTQYARLDHPYIDEARLCMGDIPGELPVSVEAGEDLVEDTQFGRFTGPACYYLVRTVRSRDYAGPAHLSIARSGPYRAWFDGREMHSDPRPRAWGGYETDGMADIELTGRPQRLVIKILRVGDETVRVQPIFTRANSGGGARGISYLCDCLEDLVVPDDTRISNIQQGMSAFRRVPLQI